MRSVSPAPCGDRELEARRLELLAWHRVLQAMQDLCKVPPRHADLPRQRYENAKGYWVRCWLRLDQVRS
jgi:hypothetical protein